MPVELLQAGLFGHLGAAAGYFLLAVLVVVWWNNSLSRAILFAASLVTAVWAASTAYDMHAGAAISRLSPALDLARSCLWALLPLSLLQWVSPARRSSWASILVAFCVVTIAFGVLFGGPPGSLAESVRQLGLTGARLVVALFGLALLENLGRNSTRSDNWSIKYLCFGIGGIFAYDFFLYSDALLFRRLDPSLVLARGVTNLLVVPLLAVYAARARTAGPSIRISRRFVFHTATLMGAGLYLMTMAAAGYYVREIGGTWSTFLQAVFFFGALLLLLLPIASGRFRAYLRVLIEKSFFKYRYDYRAEWLRFIQTVSDTGEIPDLRRRVIRAFCDIVESPEGALWVERDRGRLLLTAGWNVSRWNLQDNEVIVPLASPLGSFLQEQQWIINLDEYKSAPERYDGLGELPEWLRSASRAWLIIPLLRHERLFGFIVLGHSRADREVSWEDFDILKTVGRQAASLLAQQESDEALVEARQFETFNKRFAFVAHDIKNLVSQLSLILRNAARHRGNLDFQNDMIETVRQSVDKLNRMLRQLNPKQTPDASRSVELGRLLRDIVRERGRADAPVSLSLLQSSAIVSADEDRLKVVVDHLVQNAIDAVGTDGRVEVRLRDIGGTIVVEVEDNGPGMDAEFIRERLFRPFTSTKGSGYGIGVYESREYAKSLGGELEVVSRPGHGTIMRICLPTATEGV